MNVGNSPNIEALREVFDFNNESQIDRLDQKIYKALRKSFKTLRDLFLFPKRFIGGKDFSLVGAALRLPKAILISMIFKDKCFESSLFGTGYHRYREKVLTPLESLQFVKYAAAAGTQHHLDELWIKPVNLKLYSTKDANFNITPIKGNIQTTEKCFYDETTGLKVTISFSNNEVIVGFGALQCFRHLYNHLPAIEKQLKTEAIEKIQNDAIVKNMMGLKPLYYEQADALFQLIKNHSDFKNKKISLVGQSLGGSIAEYVAIKNQHHAICFNSVPIGAGIQEDLGDYLLSRADEFVTHVSVATDYVSDNKIVAIFDRALTLLGIRTPGNFGRRFHIPAAFTDASSIHAYVIRNLLAHLGYAKNNKFDVLTPAEMAIVTHANPSNFVL